MAPSSSSLPRNDAVPRWRPVMLLLGASFRASSLDTMSREGSGGSGENGDSLFSSPSVLTDGSCVYISARGAGAGWREVWMWVGADDIHTYIHTRIHTHTYTHTRTHAHARAHMHTYVHT